MFGCVEQNTTHSVVDFIPITDLEINNYKGQLGGKYPNGSNAIPMHHGQQGITEGLNIKPLLADGSYDDDNGKIGMAVLGYSTAAMTGNTLIRIFETTQINKQFKIAIGAQGGRDINAMAQGNSDYWQMATEQINKSGITNSQIQLVWLSSGDSKNGCFDFPECAETGILNYQLVLTRIKQVFPNCKIVFVSDRAYAGYISADNKELSALGEPSAYYTGWTVKWFIEKQLQGEQGFSTSEIPFVDWGPYLWTNGEIGNTKGYKWDKSDAATGGIHATSKGRMKEATNLYLYLTQHPYLKNIFNPE